MSAQAEPKRLLEQPGSDLDVLLLESALDEAPPARAVDRTLVALGVASAATGLCAGAASTAATVKTGVASGVGGAGWFGSLSLLSKIGVGVALVTASVGVPYVVLRDPGQGSPAVSNAAAASAEGRGAALEGTSPAATPAPGSPGLADAADAKAAAEGAAATADEKGTTAEEKGEARTKPADEPKPAVEGKAKPADGRAPAEKSGAAAASETGASKPGTSKQGGLAEELKLLDAARGALRRGDKAASLAHLDAYAARFPNGQLKAEAQSMRQAASP